MSELGMWTGPGPLRETCGPDALPLTCTLMGQPGTGILLNDTLMMCSHASAGTNDTANLKTKKLKRKLERKMRTYFAFPCGWTCVGMLCPFAEIVISRFPSPASPASTVNWTGRPTEPLVTDPTDTFLASYDFAMNGVPWKLKNLKYKS